MAAADVIVLRSPDPSQTARIGERIGRVLSAGDVVLLVGPLGSGKTTLTKGIARGLGITEEIVSPTYTIIAEYRGEKTLYHIDLYRIEGREQMENLGLDDILCGDGISVVEWGEKLDMSLPAPPVRITFTMSPPGEREICIDGLAGFSAEPGA